MNKMEEELDHNTSHLLAFGCITRYSAGKSSEDNMQENLHNYRVY